VPFDGMTGTVVVSSGKALGSVGPRALQWAFECACSRRILGRARPGHGPAQTPSSSLRPATQRKGSASYPSTLHSLIRNHSPSRFANGFIENGILDEFHSVPTGRGLLLNSDPGLRCACPGYYRFSSGRKSVDGANRCVGRLRRWMTKNEKLIELRGFPPIRQKKGKWMGHEAVLAQLALAHRLPVTR